MAEYGAVVKAQWSDNEFETFVHTSQLKLPYST